MTNVPTNGELIFWCALLLATILRLIRCNSHSSNRIDDMASWSRNYEKIQRRR